MDQPVIYIDPQRARDLDREIILQKLYYCPEGYYQNAERLRDVCKKAGYSFPFTDVKKWLDKQAIYSNVQKYPTGCII